MAGSILAADWLKDPAELPTLAEAGWPPNLTASGLIFCLFNLYLKSLCALILYTNVERQLFYE